MSERARGNWQWAVTIGIWLLGVGLGEWLWRWVKQGPLIVQVIMALVAFFYVLAMLPIHELVKEAWVSWERRH